MPLPGERISICGTISNAQQIKERQQEGTYHLPEAQLDRFLMQANVGYPNREEELQILELDSALEHRDCRDTVGPTR